jgi:hypothetical protein
VFECGVDNLNDQPGKRQVNDGGSDDFAAPEFTKEFAEHCAEMRHGVVNQNDKSPDSTPVQ